MDDYIKVQDKILRIANPTKIMFPQTGFTKRDIIRYYRKLAPVVLPHLYNRPFTFKRFPNGVESDSFFEKNCPSHRPNWIQMGHLGDVRHCLINDLPTLVWAINLAAIELHTTLATITDVDRPTMLAFDLDPGEGMDISDCLEVAKFLKAFLDRYRLESFPKTSGKKGLHVFVPLNTRTNYDETKGFAHATAEYLERHHPDLIVSKMSKKLRIGKVFIDWSQNTDFKTTTTVYSLRANDHPTVSTPITWKELLAASRKSSEAKRLLTFETTDVLKRIEKYGDLFDAVLKMKQELPANLATAA